MEKSPQHFQKTTSAIDNLFHDDIRQKTIGKDYQQIKLFANDLIKFRLIQDDEDMISIRQIDFKPEFTHKCFGEEEEIKGYEDLQINIYFLAGSLDALIDVQYSKKHENADNILECFDQVFFDGYSNDKEIFMNKLNMEKRFQPFGKQISSFRQHDEDYEIYVQNLLLSEQVDQEQQKQFSSYNRRIQTVLQFYIETASLIEYNDENWYFFTLYKRNKFGYVFVGMISLYKFNIQYDKIRFRISQVLILPQFQKKGLGFQLLKNVYDFCFEEKYLLEISVEDSSPEFQILRDYCDIRLLMESGLIDRLKSSNPITNDKEYFDLKFTQKEINLIQSKIKITKNQIQRVNEILLASKIQNNNTKIHELLKSDVKIRLFSANRKEFIPFEEKKIPYIVFKGKKQNIDHRFLFESKNLDQEIIFQKLEEYFNQLLEEYSTNIVKFRKILNISE